MGSHWSLDNITHQVIAEQKNMFAQMVEGYKNCSGIRRKWIVSKDLCTLWQGRPKFCSHSLHSTNALEQQAEDFAAAIFTFEQWKFLMN